MKKTPIGGICLSLGLLQQEEVERVLEAQSRGESGRFGEIAVRLGYLVEVAIARALARQFGVNAIPDERLERLDVPEEFLSLIPRRMIRQRHVVPVFLHRETRLLTLITADPCDRYTIHLAQAHARARSVRVFVASRTGLKRFVSRLYDDPTSAHDPGTDPSLVGPLVLPLYYAEQTLVLEPDPERWHLLRELDATEHGCTSFVADPAHVLAMLEKQPFGRLFFREEISAWVEPLAVAWHKVRPELRLCPMAGYGPGVWPTLDPHEVPRFLVDFLTWLLVATEPQNVEARHRVRLAVRLLRGVGGRLGLSDTEIDTLLLSLIFVELDQFSFLKELLRDLPDTGGSGRKQAPSHRFLLSRTLLSIFSPPHAVGALLDKLEHRLGGGGPLGDHLGAEILFTLKGILRRLLPGTTELSDLLGENLSHHHPPVVEAFSAELRAQLPSMEGLSCEIQPPEVILALSDMPLLNALEMRFFLGGFKVSVAADGQEALAMARVHRPSCLIVDWRIPKLDAPALLGVLREQADIADLPVIVLLGVAPGNLSTRAMDLGAEDVVHKPFPPELLVAKVRKIVSRRPRPEPEGIRGRIRDLPLHDLLQTLILSGRTALLHVDTDSERAQIWIDSGRLSSARFGALEGIEALKRIIALGEGRFLVEPEAPMPKPNLVGSSEWLLLEALRFRDEQSSLKAPRKALSAANP